MKDMLDVLDSGFERIDSVREESVNGFEELSRRPDDERIVLEVMSEVDKYFLKRGLTFISKQRELLQAAVEQILNRERERPIVIPLLPGMGKSTLIRALLHVLSREFAQDTEYAQQLGGAIIVVEKTAEAYELLELANQFDRHVAHVLESPNDYNISVGKCQRDDVSSFAECNGRACPFYTECPPVQSKGKIHSTPILIMLHARYEPLMENMAPFTSWVDEQGKTHARTVLIVDEAPSLLRDHQISMSEIGSLISHVSRLRPSYQEEADHRKRKLFFLIDRHLRQAFTALYKICALNHVQIMPVSKTHLAQAGFTEEGVHQLCEALTEYDMATGKEWRQKLAALLYEASLFIRAREACVIVPTRKKPDSTLSTSFLSGSAALSPELSENPDLDCMDTFIHESYAHLTIRIQQTEVFGVTKTAMQQKGNRQAVLCWLRYVLTQIPGDAKILVVTYKTHADQFWKELDEFHDRLIPLQSDEDGSPKASLPYFGGMNGSNRYAEATHVVCAGLGRFEALDYLSRALAYDFDGSAYTELCQRYSDNQLQDIRDLASVSTMESLTLARDLVQLAFRSKLRKHDSTDPVELWLVEPPEAVVHHLQAFFTGCTVCQETFLPLECQIAVSVSRTFKGKPTHAAKLLQWLQNWDGTQISAQKIRDEIDLTPDQWKEAMKNAAVRKYMESNVRSFKRGRETVYERVPDAKTTAP